MPIIQSLESLAETARQNWKLSRAYKPNLAMRGLIGIAEHIQVGTCYLVLPDGQVRTFRGIQDPDNILGTCVVRNDKFAWKFLVRGILGFCEAYLDGDWISPDMTALFTLALRNEQALQNIILGHEWWRRIEGALNYLRANTRTGSRRNIAHHYDLGNAFYEKWLDRSMTYSSGLFDANVKSNDALSEAQYSKYKNIAEMLELKPHHRLLEIGCGWGGFAEYAAREIGCSITGLTISQEQHAYATQRIADAGLKDKVDIQLCDYRDSSGEFDRIVSIEMFEAVGEKYWPQFFKILHDRLRPGGIAAMQVITIAEPYFEPYRRGADYIQKYIFPGGMLPTFNHLRELAGKACMEWQKEHLFGRDYARTLREWRQRFGDAWPKIQPLGFDERFRRMWEQYLCYCEAGFDQGTIDVCQFSFAKPLS
jgi:cyclopropane-fatty-acyl-phospholipid synthase